MSSAPPHTKAYLLKSRGNSWWVNVELELTDTTLRCVTTEYSKWVDEELGLTDYQERLAAGEPVVPSPGPEFPEAATTIAPANAALLAAIAVGLSGPPPPPRLMLMTCATGFGRSALFKVNGETESSSAMMMFEESQPPIG